MFAKNKGFGLAIAGALMLAMTACGGGSGNGGNNGGGGGGATSPKVITSQPQDADTSVATNTYITGNFDVAMDKNTMSGSTLTVSPAVNGNLFYTDGVSHTFSIHPTAPLQANTKYTVMATTGIKSSTGAPLIANYSWSFTTGSSADVTAPQIQSVSPANGATGVATNTPIKVVFSKRLDATSIASLALPQGMNGTLSYDLSTSTLTFTPSGPLASGSLITLGMVTTVTDLTGNPLSCNLLTTNCIVVGGVTQATWSFTTQ